MVRLYPQIRGIPPPGFDRHRLSNLQPRPHQGHSSDFLGASLSKSPLRGYRTTSPASWRRRFQPQPSL
jgi:hypothetical protein